MILKHFEKHLLHLKLILIGQMHSFCCCVQARALKEQLPSGAVEAGVRIFARHGQHQRSVILLQSAPSKDSVSLETLQAVFAALLQANEAALSLRLLKACSLISSYATEHNPSSNRLARLAWCRVPDHINEIQVMPSPGSKACIPGMHAFASAGYRLEHAWRGG